MIYLATLAKALLLTAHLAVGEPALCPNQTQGWDDEELNCTVLAVSEQAKIVLLKETL